jgi:hypothetical protein
MYFLHLFSYNLINELVRLDFHHSLKLFSDNMNVVELLWLCSVVKKGRT